VIIALICYSVLEFSLNLNIIRQTLTFKGLRKIRVGYLEFIILHLVAAIS